MSKIHLEQNIRGMVVSRMCVEPTLFYRYFASKFFQALDVTCTYINFQSHSHMAQRANLIIQHFYLILVYYTAHAVLTN